MPMMRAQSLFGRFQELAGLADAGIVEHDVEAAEGAHGGLKSSP